MIKRILPILTIISYLLFGACSREINRKDLKSVRIDLHWEFYFNEGKIDSSDRPIYIIFNKDYWILMDPYTDMDNQMNSGGKSQSSSIGYNYFICKKGNKFGLRYKSLTSKTGEKYPVDSLMQNWLSTPSTVYSLQDAKNGKENVIKDKKNNQIVEIITNSKLAGSPQVEFAQDSSYFYYNQKFIGLSFFNKSEKFKNMYLYKCKVIFNEKRIRTNSGEYFLDKRKWIFEMQEAKVPDKEKIIALIKRFNDNKSP